jgi:putative ABC transport system ATP-binding protein
LDNRVKDCVAELSHISKVYGTGDTTVVALNDLSLQVQRGEYLAVMGTSGSGKSTAMNILGCLDRPSSGSYSLNGTAVQDLSDDALADLRNRELGFVFQQFHLLAEMTALDNVILPMIYAGVPAEERRQRAINALERVGAAPSACITGPTSSPEASNSGWPWPGRSLTSRACCWPMNQRGPLIPAPPRRCSSSSVSSTSRGMTILVVTHEHDVADRASRLVQFHDGCLLSDSAHP